jgi:PadR family transcriptional regulator PadR
MLKTRGVNWMAKALGEFGQLILYALLSLGADAYRASIRCKIVSRTDREVSAGGVYTVLQRLEAARLITSSVDEPQAERGGRRRKYYMLRPSGALLLQVSRNRMAKLSAGLESSPASLAT